MAEPQEPQRPTKTKASVPEALDEYGLEDDQEPLGSTKQAPLSGQPLPRLWKTESEPDEEAGENGLGPSPKKTSKGDDTAASQAPPSAKSPSGKPAKSKSSRTPAPQRET